MVLEEVGSAQYPHLKKYRKLPGSITRTASLLAVSVVLLSYFFIVPAVVHADDTFVLLNNPSIPPANTGYSTAYSPDSTYLAVAHATSPFVTIYKRLAAPTVTTVAASAIGTDSATLNMSYTTGDYTPDVRFAYKKAADAVWTETSWVANPGSPYSLPLSGLDSNTTYDFKAQLKYNSTEIEGSELQFTTGTTPPSVTTNAVSAVTTNSATLNGNLDDLGTAATVDVSFVWGETSGGPYSNETVPSQTMTGTGTFNFNLGGLAPGRTYYFKAKADGGAHGTSYGGELSFVTSGASYRIPTATGTGVAIFTTGAGFINNLTASATTACGGSPSASLIFPHGFFSFNITNITPGSTVTITITLPSAMPPGTQYWKCINGQWVNCISLLGSNDGDNIITLTITDGGLGDADGAANGIIVDPGGPAVPGGYGGTRKAAEGASTGSLPVRLAPPNLKPRQVSVSSGVARVNQPVTVAAEIVNEGETAGSTNVALVINGYTEQVQTIRLEPGGARTVTFTVEKTKPGKYEISVGNQRASLLVVDDTAKSTPSVNGSAIALMLLSALAVVVIGVFVIAFHRLD